MSWRIVCDNNDEMSELLNPTSLEGYPSRTRAIREKDKMANPDSASCPLDGHHCTADACAAKLRVVYFPPTSCWLG
jgi:hypothetical protein